MANTSKDLLHLEHKNSSSVPESTLLVFNKEFSNPQCKKPNPGKNSITAPLPKSQVLGKLKDFLGVISEANKRLEVDAKDNAQEYNIEVLNGNESEVIEMDLMLGVADLNTPEAVAAAEAAIASHEPVIPLAIGSGESDLEDSSDDDDDDDSSDDDDDDKRTHYPLEHKRSMSSKNDSLTEAAGKTPSGKRSKIVELS
ncbi:hypothetical protein CFOL_v3_23748 [Cephalotus follicularis]|uniref:Uncharacterized protein n=1 Tax=Cephalotus follicularis TaxID=3775 RepID=A0A1Q3CJ88_CEPFO|nr:hypothetical protein CFOL_v3_23748 [Cephalotus follicularis]